MKRTMVLFALVAMLMVPASVALADPIQFVTALSGANEMPSNASPGTGLAMITLDPLAHLLSVNVSFSGLLGNVTAAHIHCCTDSPNNIGVATMTPTFAGFPLGVTAGTYNHFFDLEQPSSFNTAFLNSAGGTPAAAEAMLLAGMQAGRAYFNIHSTAFLGGEIRGFLRPVPEPSTLLLCGTGIIALIGVASGRNRQ
jgi:hypothetical protein